MGTALIIALVLILILFFVSKGKDGIESFSQPHTPQQSTQRVSSYVSVEHGEFCDKVYFCSTWICSAIRDKIGMDSISMYDSDKKLNKSFVKKMEPISMLHFKWREYYRNPSIKGAHVEKTREEPILSPCEGYILYHPIPMFCNGSTFLLASFYKDYKTLLEQEFAFDYRVETDAFNYTDSIVWEIVNGEENTQHLWVASPTIKVSFNLQEGKPILLVWYRYKTTKGTQIELLFDDKTILSYPLFGESIADGSVIIPISPSDIEYFSAKKLFLIRIGKDENNHDYSVDADEQEALMRFATSFKQAIESMVEDKEFQAWCERVDREHAEKEARRENDSCWVYLMHDLANNAYKIGISNNPEYRERTLQSEKPSIEKIAAKQFPTRDIARAFEASLHKVYESRRLRGEWFKLEPNEVEDVKKTLE